MPPHCYYNPSRPSWLLGGTLRISSLLTPERGVARTTHLGVSPHLPSNKEIYLLRDYRPTIVLYKNWYLSGTLVYVTKNWITSAVSTQPMGGWNSTFQAAWYVRHAHWARLCYIPFEIWCLWITSTIWLLILSSTSVMLGRSHVFYIYFHERYRSVTPLGTTRTNTRGSTGRFYKDDVAHNHSAHGYYISRRGRVRLHDTLLHVKQNKTKLSKTCHPYNTRIGSG